MSMSKALAALNETNDSCQMQQAIVELGGSLRVVYESKGGSKLTEYQLDLKVANILYKKHHIKVTCELAGCLGGSCVEGAG